MVEQELEYGDGYLQVQLPDSAIVLQPGRTRPEPPPLQDPIEATRQALRNPLGTTPIPDQVGRGSRVVIAFPDRVKGGSHATAHRRVTIPLLVEELERAGVRRSDITLVCAIGLHRKNTHEEFAAYLGPEVMGLFRPEQVINHDPEDPEGVVDLGTSALGDVVEVNRLVVEADLAILIGHAAGNPYGGFSGGYKMPATGLTTWRSIRCHHSPHTINRADFVPVSTGSHFRQQLQAIGQRMETAMPRPFFVVDAALNAHAQQIDVHAGAIPAVEAASWPVAAERADVTVSGEPAEVLVVGIPRNFHYGNGMGSNPILMMQGIGASLVRARGAMVEHPVVIATSICDGWFNDTEFPAMRQLYELLQSVDRPSDMTRFEEEVATDPEYRYRFRHKYAYHPFHGFSMVYMGALARQITKATYIVGAKSPGHARGMGAIPVPTFAAAMSEAERHVGRHPRMLVVPALSQPSYHLSLPSGMATAAG